MPRRHHDDGPSVESDSFLDIVANIVGILIILIVVAAVRVGESSSLPEIQPAMTDPPPLPGAVEPLRLPPPPEEAKPVLVAPQPVLVFTPPEPVEPIPVSPELVASIGDTETAIRSLYTQLAALEQQKDALSEQRGDLIKRFPIAQQEANETAQRLRLFEEQAADTQSALIQLQTELAGFNRQITDIPTENTTVLKHQLNPIGRSVTGKELHFRLSENRVAFIPIEDLVSELRPQLERQKEWIARNNRYQGTVGPIKGFRMIFIAERVRTSVHEDLRFGGGTLKIQVAGWKVEPDVSLRAETAAEALRADSRFVNALRLADAGTTVTLWTYPDSFDLFRQLQEAIHEAGLPVAARPLPAGAPIAGSPNGSRSTSQ